MNIVWTFSSHKGKVFDEIFLENLKKNMGDLPPNVKISFKAYPNFGEYSLTEIYNKILSENQGADWVVFSHNDMSFLSQNWLRILVKNLKQATSQDYSILGFAGTKCLYSSGNGCWWFEPNNKYLSSKMYGTVYHQNPENKQIYPSYYSVPHETGVIEEVVLVDGCCMIVAPKKIPVPKFNEMYSGFHFYDVSFCIENFKKGAKIGVISDEQLALFHQSQGQTNSEWEKNRALFYTLNNETYQTDEYEDIGLVLKALNVALIFSPDLQTDTNFLNQFNRPLIYFLSDELSDKDIKQIKKDYGFDQIPDVSVLVYGKNLDQNRFKTMIRKPLDLVVFPNEELALFGLGMFFLNKAKFAIIEKPKDEISPIRQHPNYFEIKNLKLI
jgi:hypothetical protein